MNCENAREHIILAAYGELPDENSVGLERHLSACEECLRELNALRAMLEQMELKPLLEPDPNLVAQSRLRLDEALDAMPHHGAFTRLQANWWAWMGHLQGAPALATLLLGVGFLGGNFLNRYQVAHAPKLPPAVILSNTTGGGIASISGITQLPGDMVQVSYNRVVPEMAQGSLDDPQIRQLLMTGTRAATENGVRVDSVALLANECKVGHQCRFETDGSGIQAALVSSLLKDKSAGVRLKALDGLQSYVSQDEKVRDAVAQAMMTDASATVRGRAIEVLAPVLSDTSVRQALRTVSTRDDNPYLRTVSTQALQGVSSIQ